MANLNQMSSQSSAGASVITLQFNLDIPLDIAEQSVQAAINAAGNLLPSDLPAPRSTPRSTPPTAPVDAGADLRDDPADAGAGSGRDAARPEDQSGGGRRPRQHGRRAAAGGAGAVQFAGARRLRAQHRRPAHDHRNLNVNTPKGNIDGPTQSYAINANDQVRDPSVYANSIIAYRNGAPVHLTDVADVVDAPENTRLGAWADRTPAVILNIQRQPGANVIDTVDRIKKLLQLSRRRCRPPSPSRRSPTVR